MMYLILSWRNIWRNRRRTLITLSSIGFAVFFACIMQSMQLGVYERMIDNTVRFSTGHLQIHAQGYWEEKVIDKSITWNVNNKLERLAVETVGVVAFAPRLESFSLASYGDKTKGVMVVGTDPEREEAITKLSSKLIEGEYFDKGSGVLLGTDLASFLSLGIGDTIVLISQGYHGVNAAGKYAVSGIMKFPSPEFNEQAVFMKLPEAQHFYGAENLITSLSLLLDDSDEINSAAEQLSRSLDKLEYEVMTWQEMMPELVQSIELDYYSGFIMIFILYGVIAFGIFGTFLMMTKERTYEFGILTAIGMKKFKIVFMVALEILMLALLGVGSGGVVSFPVILYLYYNPIYLTGNIAEAYKNFGFEAVIPFSLDPSIFLNQGMIILFVAIVLGIYPLYAIQSLRTVNALKE